MALRRIGQEVFGFGVGRVDHRSSLDKLSSLIDWSAIKCQLRNISSAAKGEPAWRSVDSTKTSGARGLCNRKERVFE
jgi:hypothetical protein